MKKIIILISAVALLAVFAISCKSSNKCAAYGENHKYQKESKY
jgi:hypothetical protein|tara:strand:- start:965 stop:1093 length:129 start_codon:yes stop_codon:yes gene_type:complete